MFFGGGSATLGLGGGCCGFSWAETLSCSTAFSISLISAWIELKAESCRWCFSLFSDKFRSSSWLFLSTHLLHTCRTFFPSSLRQAIAVSEKPVQLVVRWRMQSHATQRKTSSLEGMSLLHVLHLPWVSEADFWRVLCIIMEYTWALVQKLGLSTKRRKGNVMNLSPGTKTRSQHKKTQGECYVREPLYKNEVSVQKDTSVVAMH